MSGFVTVDGIPVPIEGEKNLLALIRKANIDIPTFCYHSHLSTYGACRLCLVEINGREIDASCVVPPKDGMSIKTSTPKIRSMRRMNLELILANHKQDCPVCERSESCKLRDLSAKMGIHEVRFKPTKAEKPKDEGSVSLVRDPNKCILCGDCVRYCSEIQAVGAIDFVYRGGEAEVSPAFGRSLGEVGCVNCGQCAAVCPTAAIVPRNDTGKVWADLDNPKKVVAAQIAPAVRVALGEHFGLSSNESELGKIGTALRMLGFDKVYDTAFGADLTVVEEANEFLERKKKGENLPIFTSCCPAWVKFAEHFFPDALPNLSTCKSPQSMMGALLHDQYDKEAEKEGKEFVVVSVMPCTAKKFEITRPELSINGKPLVSHVITTSELASMIQEAGIRFADLDPVSMDLPMGFASGAGIVFGNAGGVSEAVARYVAGAPGSGGSQVLNFIDEVPEGGIRTATLGNGDQKIRIVSVQGLANAKRVVKEITEGKREADIVEVMACPGGCIGGAGQPISYDPDIKYKRSQGLHRADTAKQLRTTQSNPFVDQYYREIIKGDPGCHKAHELLHTHYSYRKRIGDLRISLVSGNSKEKVAVKVCVGTNCFLKGSQEILGALTKKIDDDGISGIVSVTATFCKENCGKGPTVHVGSKVLSHATPESVLKELDLQLNKN
jgi:NADH-quinone oxidoreductase subunit G